MKTETVAQSFATYRAEVIPPNASDVQVEECRRSFYAGAYFLLLNVAYNIGDDSTSEDQGVEELEKLKAELETFSKNTAMPLPQAAPPPPIIRDVNFTTPDPHSVRPILQELGDHIRAELPIGWGFTLLLFEFGEGGSLFYIANADRADVIKTMREFIQKQTQ